MNIHQFRNNFRRVKNAWIPRQAKSSGGKGPNATEAKYLREVLKPRTGKNNAITYQPPSLRITETAGREYTADFLVSPDPNGSGEWPAYHEVKGSYHLPTHERARLAWEIAAEQNPECEFVWAELTRKGWEIENWTDGGRVIAVHYAGTPMDEWHSVAADWRRHRPRRKKISVLTKSENQ